MKAKTYFTGKPCKNGHISERYKSTNMCVECILTNARKRREIRNAQKEKPVYYFKMMQDIPLKPNQKSDYRWWA